MYPGSLAGKLGAEMQLAKGEFTVLRFFEWLRPFSEQWATQEGRQGSVSSTISPVLGRDELNLNGDRGP